MDPAPTPLPRKRPAWLRRLSYAIAALVLVVAVLVFALQTGPARRYLLAQVTSLLAAQGITFSSDHFRYNLLDLSADLRNVRIMSPQLPDGPSFLEIDRARVDLSSMRLLRGRYVVQDGSAEGVRLHYLVNEEGVDNLPRPVRDPDQPSNPVDYLIEALSVPNAVVRYENRQRNIDITLPAAALTMKGNALTNRHDVTIEAAGGEARVDDRLARIDRVALTLDLGRDDVNVERAEIEAEGALLSASGSYGPFDQPVVKLAVQATLDAARAGELAKLGEPVSGQLSAEGNITGPLGAIAFDGRIQGHGVHLRDLRDLAIDTNVAYEMGRDVVRVSHLRVTGPIGAFTGSGEVAIAGTARSKVSASVEALRAEPLMRALRLPYRAASRVDGQVSAEWPGLEYARALGNARLFLTPTTQHAAGSTLPVGGRVDVTGDGERVDATLRGVSAAGVTLDGRVTLGDRTTIGGDFRAHVPNVNTTVNVLEAFLGRAPGSLVPVPVAGALSANGRIAGTVSAPVIRASMAAPSLAVGDASGINVTSNLIYRRSALAIERADVVWQQARAHAQGVVGLTGRQPIDLSITADRLQVGDLLRAVQYGHVPATGIVSATAQVGGTVGNPIATLHVQGTNLVAYNETLGTLNADARLAGRTLDVTRFALAKPQAGGAGTIVGTGSYHFTNRNYALDVRSQNVRLESLQLPDGRTVTGEVELIARGSGSIDRPAGTINLQTNDLLVDDVLVGRVVADTTLETAVATTQLTADRFGLRAASTVETARPFLAKVSAQVTGLDLAALPLQLQTPLEGRMHARIEAEGPLTDLQRGRADAAVETFAGTWRQQPFTIDGPARFRYAGEQLTIDQLKVQAQDSTIAVSGNLPLLDRSAPGIINVDATANLATLAQYAPAGSDIAADGRLTLRGTLQGTLKAIDPNLQVTLAEALVLSPAIEPGISNLNATATIAAGEATVQDLTANWGSAQIKLAARAPLDLLPQLPVEIPRQGGPATVRASLDGLNPSAIPGAPSGLSGRISFDADIQSRTPDVREAEGKVAFRDLQLGFEGLTLEQKAPSAIAVRNGVASVEQFALGGSVGTLAVTGTVGLAGDRPINVDVDGGVNIAAVALVTDRVRAEGESVIDIAARGTVAEPVLSGNVTINDGTMVIDEPRIAAEAINARIDLNQNRAVLSRLSADVNGGTLTGKGELAVRGGTIADVDMTLEARDFAFDAPLDLRSLSDSDIRITSDSGNILIGGQVTIQEAGLTGDVNFDTGLLSTVTARRQLELTPERNPLLERVSLDVNVDTATPILVDNNLAKAEVTTDVRVVGTPYETGLLGRLEVAEGGLVTLNERTFEIERGAITFLEDRRIFPSFDLSMNTSAQNYDITLGVTGEPGNTETTMTSSPPLPEPDIMAILVTGRTLDEMRGEEYDVAREQVLSYLTGRVGSSIGRGLERATGLNVVRIEPHLIANEADPGARLTLGEEISDDLTLTYSVDLADSDDQIWLATYDVTKRFQARAIRQNDNSYRVDFRHDIRKGGRPEPRRMPRVRPEVTSVTVPEDAPISAAELRKMLGVEEGDDLDYFAVRNGMEDIEQRLREAGWAQSRVRLDRKVDQGAATLNLRIVPGPQVEFVYAGAVPPRKVQEAVQQQWHRGVFDAQRTDDAAETLTEWLMRDDYLQAKVDYRIDDSNPSRRRVEFHIAPGPRSSRVLLVFNGASGISPEELDQVIDEQKLERQLFTDPTVVTELLQRLYREQGYLNAEIDKPRYEYEGPVARVVLDIREGARFVISDVTTAGNAAIAGPELLANAPVVEGDPFLPLAVENALQHIRRQYWARGYNEARVTHQLTIDRVGGRTGVAFTIDEGRQAVVSEIRIAGNDETSDRLVREQVIVQPGEPLNLQALSRSRKNLYDSGAFSIVDLSRDTVVEVPPAEAGSAVVGAIAGLEPSTQKPVAVVASVREVQPFQIRYGASFDTEAKLGGVVDASVHNVFGKARVLGVSARYDAQVRDGRLYLSQPTLLHWPIQTMASLYYREERNPATTVTDAFNVDRKGISIQQERKLKNAYIWTYGYRFEQARTFDPLPDGVPEQFIKVSPLSSSFVRETRDEVLDATRGAFTSHALQFSPKWLGSDDTYMKYFGQYFHYFPLQRERRKRFTNDIIRPRLVIATAARIGVSKGMGTFVPSSERFYAGGSTTLRGFEQNAVGPIGVTGVPVGGDAMLLLNGELRFPLLTPGYSFLSMVDGVGFVDVGNVWQKTSEFSFSDLRRTAGVGLRLRTRWVLVRTDYGVILDRRDGERRGRFYFSIGQAF